MRKVLPRTLTGTASLEPQLYEILHARLSRKAAAEGMVLLKNEDELLPLDLDTSIDLYGWGATQTVSGGTGSGEVNRRYSVSIYDGLKNAGYTIANEASVLAYAELYTQARKQWHTQLRAKAQACADGFEFFETVYVNTSFIPPAESVTVGSGESAIYVLSRIAGEGKDRSNGPGDYLLSPEERSLLSAVCAEHEKVIVVLNVGGPVDLSFLDEHPSIKALVLMGQAGMEGGSALADILSGKVCPSGKLTDSWAFSYNEYPGAENFSYLKGDLSQEDYREGIFVGYRWFDSADFAVRYGFGYGLSYTKFDFEAVDLTCKASCLTMTVTVNNCGGFSGAQVMQLYAACPQGQLPKEYRRLCAYKKTGLLSPGAAETLELTVPLELLASYDEKQSVWLLEKGQYIFWLGDSLETSMAVAELLLDDDVVISKCRSICPPRTELPFNDMNISREPVFIKTGLSLSLSAVDIKKQDIFYDILPTAGAEAKALADQLSTQQLISMVCGDPGRSQNGAHKAKGIYVPGSAAETSACAEESGIAPIILADGPAGLRLNRHYDVENGEIVPQGLMASLEGGALCDDVQKGERRYQFCTAFPVGTVLAQSWDEELQRSVGMAVGDELQRFGVTLWLAPGMNIHRNPLCGRNFEYFSEDPLLSGLTAAAVTEGVQSVKGCGVTIKHFAANNLEDNRMHSDSRLSQRALREIYLKGFEIAVKKAQPMAIMTSYNKINGVHAANCSDICTTVARNEWGFKGLIMTDWTTTLHGPDCTASGCILAGNDLIMPGAEPDIAELNEAVDSGRLPIEMLRESAARVIDCVLSSGKTQ